MVEVRVFGGLSATVDGRPVELPADTRARELLARLALSPGPLPRSTLAGQLRPDVPEESARKTLRNALYELRRALGAEAVVATGERIALNADVDFETFRRHLSEGDLEAAAGAARGELLAGLDDDWALRARDEHAAEMARVLAELAARAESMPAAIGWARRRVEVEPLAEAAHRDLIRLLALSGDRPAALTAAQTMTDRLRTQLGIPPSAETRALVEDVRRGRIARPAEAASAPPLPRALAATEPPAGRAADLARLEQAWAGDARFALITGEPGIGKTTLAAELARRAYAEGGAVLLGRSDEQALVPFQPWIEALEHLLESLPDADDWLTAHDGALARLLPARSPAQDAPGQRERYLAFELARELLDHAAAQRPLLLVLDDVHWADPDSLSLLRHLARAASKRRVLVVLSARADELAPATAQVLAELRREGPLVHIDLAGLDEEAVAALLERRTGSTDRLSARRYRARTGGNPFFLEELMREDREAGGDAPPAGVRDVIARRRGRLADPAQLDAAAVLGLEFDVATVARVDERPVAEVLEALDGAVAAALVAETGEPGRFAFAHALVRDTITSALPPSRRSQLHARIAGVLAEQQAGAGEVVRHLRSAGPLADADRLATWELAAAREATAALAHAEAAAHYEAAAALRPGDGEVLLALGDALDRAGRRAQARAAFAQAAELDPRLLPRAALGHGGVSVVIAAADPTTVRLLEEALEVASTEDRPRLLARLSVELYYEDRSRARELGALAVAEAQPATRAAALNAHRVALWSPYHADERLAIAGDMLAAAEAGDDREAVLQARNWRVVDLLELGRVQEAVDEVDAYEALADAVALPHFRWYVPLWRSTLAILAGRWAEADELTGRARELGRQADDPNASLLIDVQRHHALYAQRRFTALGRTRLVEGADASPATAEWQASLALLDAQRGATGDARALLTELTRDNCAALAMDANWHGACMLAETAVLLEDREAGAALYALLEPLAGLFPLIARAVGCLGSNEFFVGLLASLLGREDEAEARLRRAVEENDSAGAGPAGAVALLRLGELRGDRELLQDVARRAHELDMPALVAEAERDLTHHASWRRRL